MKMRRPIPAQKERAGTYITLGRAARLQKLSPSLLKTGEHVDEPVSLQCFGCKLRARQRLHLTVDKMKLFFLRHQAFGELKSKYLKDAPDPMRRFSPMLVSWTVLWSRLPAKGHRNPSLSHGQCCAPPSLLSHLSCQTNAALMA